MSFKDIDIKVRYRSDEDDFTRDFLIPVLSETSEYRRSVGYFSTTALVNLSVGLFSLAKRAGHVELVCSPNLTDDDIKAIEYGYKTKEQVLEHALMCSLTAPLTHFQEERLNLVATMIATGLLEIKLAYLEDGSRISVYHEKIALFIDEDNNKIAFTGSMNETENAFTGNFESIYTFCSWKDASQETAVRYAEKDFEKLWHNHTAKLKIIDFPEAILEKILTYQNGEIDYKTDQKEFEKQYSFFRVPENVNLYEYQNKAIETWEEHSFCGIFDMATGTGKTFTALGALSRLSETLDEHLAVIIVAPYRHLVDQWVEDIGAFNVTPIVAYSGPGLEWRKRFSNAVNAYNLGVLKNFCIITTNATFMSDEFQSTINKFRKNFCFVADEAHNLGALKIRQRLPRKARYRLGLSATIVRYRDTHGTDSLYQYFGRTCITFTLKEAIQQGYLTPYYYFPVIVYLDEQELADYMELSSKISKMGFKDDDEIPLSQIDDTYLKMLLIKRARIIAGCRQKVGTLLELMKQYKNDSHMLVYCGATKYDLDGLSDQDEIRQIDLITQRIGIELGMKVRRFTSDEKNTERSEIKEMFQNETIQIITAIKCLDEGVNIPAIHRAFILASSTNPKEYIQRRGRVLRKAPGKQYAEIFDFITLPRHVSSDSLATSADRHFELSMIKREFRRMEDFTDTALNPSEIDSIKENIMSMYYKYYPEVSNYGEPI